MNGDAPREKVMQLKRPNAKVNWMYLHIDLEVRHNLIAAIAAGNRLGADLACGINWSNFKSCSRCSFNT